MLLCTVGPCFSCIMFAYSFPNFTNKGARQGPFQRNVTKLLLPCIVSSLCAISVHSFSKLPSPSIAPHGQRYLHIPGPTDSPPLLIIPGTAQTIELWQQHIPFLLKSRTIVICEPVGVGLQVPRNLDMSIPSQAEILYSTLTSIKGCEGPFDIAGFSLGGRIALSLACLYPDTVHRLHLTGVALQRSSGGILQITSWKDLLEQENTLRPFAWSALLASYSPEFLIQQKEKLPLWIDGLCQRHTLEGLRQLVHQTHQDEKDEEWSVAAMTERMPLGIKGHLCVGHHDQLAPVEHVRDLANALQWPNPTIISDSAHVPPIENPRAWRRDLEDFLSRTQS